MTQESLNFLLVEDDALDVMNVQRAFKKNNIANPLFVAEHGVEALTMLRGDGQPPAVPPERRIILLDLVEPLNKELGTHIEPEFREPRAGDVRDSLASLERVRATLGYMPEVVFREGLRRTLAASGRSDE